MPYDWFLILSFQLLISQVDANSNFELRAVSWLNTIMTGVILKEPDLQITVDWQCEGCLDRELSFSIGAAIEDSEAVSANGCRYSHEDDIDSDSGTR